MYHAVTVEQAASEQNDLHLLLGTFLCALANLPKVTSSFVVSVRLSVRMGQLGFHCMDFHEV